MPSFDRNNKQRFDVGIDPYICVIKHNLRRIKNG